jgi:molecular chaperone DnaK
MNQAVGIDLGTTFSSVAIVGDQSQAYAIPNAQGKRTTPSLALWYEGDFLVGQPALEKVAQAQGEERMRLEASLIRGVKRMVGRPPPGGLLSNGRHTNPVEVSTAILRSLVRDASAHLGYQVKDVVITVPAHFVDKERHAISIAAENAGLHVLQIINEPSAAALAYTRGQTAQEGTALVFDLGGGTFDATLLHLTSEKAQVLATTGIEELGGINFTNCLAHALSIQFERITHTRYPDDSFSAAQLVEAAETAKCLLSHMPATVARLSPSSGQSVQIEVTRQQFEELIELLLFQLQVAVEQALDAKQKNPLKSSEFCCVVVLRAFPLCSLCWLTFLDGHLKLCLIWTSVSLLGLLIRLLRIELYLRFLVFKSILIPVWCSTIASHIMLV